MLITLLFIIIQFFVLNFLYKLIKKFEIYNLKTILLLLLIAMLSFMIYFSIVMDYAP